MAKWPVRFRSSLRAGPLDIAEFEAADKEVKDPDLKKFIEKTVPVMKHHGASLSRRCLSKRRHPVGLQVVARPAVGSRWVFSLSPKRAPWQVR
jgi:hypothetical protein